MTQFRLYQFIILLLGSTSLSCKKDKSSDPNVSVVYASPVNINIKPGMIDEASGMVASGSFPNHLWVEMDGGNSNDIYLLSEAGIMDRKVNIKSAINRDWEDMAFTPANSSNPAFLYLGDFGDNAQNFEDYFIYRFPEPGSGVDTITRCDKIRFRYPDGAHDSEAMLVDPGTLDIFMFTKRDDSTYIYRLSYPQDISGMNLATRIAALEFTGVVGAGTSTSGDQILIKTYTDIYHWNKSTDASIEETLMEAPVKIPYMAEAQGEAVCFGFKSDDFYTLSERPEEVSSIQLRYYKRQ